MDTLANNTWRYTLSSAANIKHDTPLMSEPAACWKKQSEVLGELDRWGSESLLAIRCRPSVHRKLLKAVGKHTLALQKKEGLFGFSNHIYLTEKLDPLLCSSIACSQPKVIELRGVHPLMTNQILAMV